jgi:hypothetical protein
MASEKVKWVTVMGEKSEHPKRFIVLLPIFAMRVPVKG